MSDGTTGSLRDRPAVERFVREHWGVDLPDSLFRFHTFLASLGPVERRALEDLWVSPAGIMDLLTGAAPTPREGIDIRVHGRYYRDPPEFLTFMHAGSDGLHYGLWFDDGRTCTSVASYYTNDGGGIDRGERTPLEALRTILERCWRDLADDDPADPEVSRRRSSFGGLREALTRFETGDRAECGTAYLRAYAVPAPVDRDRITTLDGAGALVSGRTALDRPRHNGADEHAFAEFMYALFEDPAAVRRGAEEAHRRCAAGDPAEALVLGRDLHWASGGDPELEETAAGLLASAYRALGRPALAGIAAAHRRHRDLPRVDVLVR